ncbi:TldD/PmbA family protein [Spirosoma foliorum]|uniref:TldD/PmbA family protein n=1 Tax=Spirosoma foliorum TaxID=2710596 RepID=A0A7G5GY58_9BACT|nr:TldD/PmbA family protein [Spirosoma foliorum]QMW03800.1 TldD/PmbA family protein [Spirosoma foliorum]
MAIILTEADAKTLLQKVLSYSKADECEVNLQGEEWSNIRYALNKVTTCGSKTYKTVSVQSAFGKKVGVSTVDEFDDASLEKAVRRSEEVAQLAPENPEYIGLLGPQQYLPASGFFDSTANMSAVDRAKAVAQSIQIAKTQKQTVAGYLEDRVGYSAMMNSKGLFAYYPSTKVNFSATIRTDNGTGSGYATQGVSEFPKLNTASATQIALQKALGSVGARAIEPGKYTVILEPLAAAVLLEHLFRSLDARSADEGRSFLSKPGGKTKLGEKIMDERVTIYSDPTNPELPSSPWSADGRAQEKLNWIEKGVVKNLSYSRYWAQKKGVKAVPAPTNFMMVGGTASLDELIKSTQRGILVTKFWYIRSVDPQSLLVTGLTRDGTFYIENGKIKHPIKNFRFNESPVIMLNNLETLGKVERVVSSEGSFSNYLIPSMKIREFTFTSLSDAV